MPKNLAILVVGASRGIGLELARQSLADGHRVIAADKGLLLHHDGRRAAHW